MKSKGKSPTRDQIRAILDTKEPAKTLSAKVGVSQKIINEVRHRGDAAVHYRNMAGRCPDCGCGITTKVCLACDTRRAMRDAGVKWTEEGCVKK